jgi:K+-transporting ATPase ATPase A chain
MTISNYIVCGLLLLFAIVLGGPLGRFLSRVYWGEKSLLDFLQPAEEWIYRMCRINAKAEMNWKQYLLAIFVTNGIWFAWSFLLLLFQGGLWLNPAHNPAMDWSLAFNTAVSFVTCTDLQHYSGETGSTYLTQLIVFIFLQFVSSATSLSAGIATIRGLSNRSVSGLGNFYKDLVRSITRILLPFSIVAGVLFAFRGVPDSFTGPETIHSLQGDTVQVATGPAAAWMGIKEIGTDGGGFYGANNAHPFENPDHITFLLHCLFILVIPLAFVYCIGYYLKNRKFSRTLFWVMAIAMLLITLPMISQETKGNPFLTAMGIDNSAGNMEGKEVRMGSGYSAFYSGINFAVTGGTITGMQDSFMPLSAVTMFAGMEINAFGALGTGWIGMFFYLLIAVFVGSLMIGRSPEVFGKKVETAEIKWVAVVTIAQLFVPLTFAGIACFVYVNYPGGNSSLGWLSNPGSHGFSTMVYEYVSSYAGNGSGFEGLGDNTVFWNTTTGVTMLIGRYLPIAGAIAIAGSLQGKTYNPPSPGTLKTHGMTFAFFLLVMIIVLTALSLFIVYMAGPLAEHFTFFR